MTALTAAGISHATHSRPFIRHALGGLLLLLFGILTWRQCSVYRDIEMLWRDTLKKNPACWMAHVNLGVVLDTQEQYDEAIKHYEEALRLKPNYPEAQYNYGRTLAAQGNLPEAVLCFERALQLQTNFIAAHYNLGLVLAAQGKLSEAIPHYLRAFGPKSNNAAAHYQLGLALAGQGRLGEAGQHFQKALELARAAGNARLAEFASKALRDYSPIQVQPKTP
jgi:tetratricopeptide (TPR) repeat protein